MDYDIGIVRRRRIISPAMAGPGAVSAGAAALATTWNPSDKTSNVDLSNGNLTATANNSAGGDYARSVAAAVSNQKVYFENVLGTNFSFNIGFSTLATVLSGSVAGAGVSPSTAFYVRSNQEFKCLDSADDTLSIMSAPTTGDEVDVAFDTGLGRAWFRRTRGGTTLAWNDLLSTQDPATGTGGVRVPFSGPYYAILYMNADSGDNTTTRFAQSSWVRNSTVPAGFTQLAA